MFPLMIASGNVINLRVSINVVIPSVVEGSTRLGNLQPGRSLHSLMFGRDDRVGGLIGMI